MSLPASSITQHGVAAGDDVPGPAVDIPIPRKRPARPRMARDVASGDQPFDTSWTSQPPLVREGFPILFLVILALLLTWNRAVYDWWLGRHDVISQEVPWNDLLGRQIRSLILPGWDPYLFSGSPLAGDPRSGWGFWFNMIPFTLFADPLVAYKVKVGIDMIFAIVTTYALARTLRIGQIGAMVSGIVFTFGPLSFYETHCCTVRGYLSLTMPAAFLGVELTMRAERWPMRFGGFALASFAVSQWWASFPGQGSIDATLLIGAWIVYRGAVSPAVPQRPWRERVVLTVATGLTVVPFGLVLDLWALWPRVEVYRESTLYAGYSTIIGYDVGPYDLPGLLRRFIIDRFGSRDVTIAAGAIVLMVLAPFLARTRYAVPFFTGMTIVIASLTLTWSPLLPLFQLVPGWLELHQHNVPITLSTIMTGPAILAGASVDRLWTLRGRAGLALPIAAPFITIILLYVWFAQAHILLSWSPIIAAGLVTLLISLVVDDRWTRRFRRPSRVLRLIPVAIMLVVYMQPMGLELVDGAIGRSLFIKEWTPYLNPPAREAQAADVYVHSTGPGGSGDFLLDARDREPVFRFAAYDGSGEHDPVSGKVRGTVVQRRYDANTEAMQQNGRSIYLDVPETQGYNPTQLARYADFMAAVNGARQDYHFAQLNPPYGNLTLLNLLNVEYLLVDASLPLHRRDVATLVARREPVYEDQYVRIYQNADNLGPAWIVHDITPTSEVIARVAIRRRSFAPTETAYVEGNPPPLANSTASPDDSVAVTAYSADTVRYATRTSTRSFLITSEIYENGWKAYIDGREVPIYPTDVALRGVMLPAGSHTVEMRYEPPSLRLGFVMSVTAHVVLILALIGVFAWDHRRRRRAGAPSGRPSTSGATATSRVARVALLRDCAGESP